MKHKILLILAVLLLTSVCFQPTFPVQGYRIPESAGLQAAEDACTGLVNNTPYFSFAYGTVMVNGSAAPAGSVVQARSPRGDVVGCFVVTSAGDYGTMYIFGEDTSVSPAIPGMRTGEMVSFIVDGSPSTPSPALSWQNDKEIHQVNLSATISVLPDFTANPTSGTAPMQVQFTDATAPAATAWNWSFGDGGTSIVKNPLYTYTSPGTYTVRLSVTTSSGAGTQTKVGLITVNPVIQADFSANPASGSVPLNVQFTNLSSGSFTSSSWTFGDGGTSTLANPSHTYTVPGTYNVSLAISGTDGSDTETKNGYIVVSSSSTVTAEFQADKTAGPAPLSVQFTNESGGNYNSSSWNFGDNTTSSATHPLHTYQNPGTYTVTLLVSGSGGSDTETKTGYITIYTPVSAAFQADVVSGPAPLFVQFTNQSTGDYDTSVWNFGDNSTSGQKNPAHTYSMPGLYTVTLTANGPGGNDTETKAQYISVYAPVHAEFHATPAAGAAPLLVSFVNDSTGNYTSSFWNFGDGTTSSQANPSHNYANPGNYTVTLTISGAGGTDSETKTGYIQAYDPPNPDFIGTPLSGKAPLQVSFTNISTGTFDSVSWNFGDGNAPVTQDNPIHTFENGGTHTVSLTIDGPAGSKTKTKTGYITVTSDAPVVNFEMDVNSGKSPLTVHFTNHSSGAGTLSYTWNFGDGSPTSSETNPVHVYSSTVEKNFTIRLTVTANSISSYKELPVTVIPNHIYLPLIIR